MASTQFAVACVEDGIGFLGQGNIGGVVASEIVPQLPNAAEQGNMRKAPGGKCGQVGEELLDAV